MTASLVRMVRPETMDQLVPLVRGAAGVVKENVDRKVRWVQTARMAPPEHTAHLVPEDALCTWESQGSQDHEACKESKESTVLMVKQETVEPRVRQVLMAELVRWAHLGLPEMTGKTFVEILTPWGRICAVESCLPMSGY